MQSPRRKIATHVVVIAAIVVMTAVSIWLGTGPVALSPEAAQFLDVVRAGCVYDAFPLEIDQDGASARVAQALSPLRRRATVFRVVTV